MYVGSYLRFHFHFSVIYPATSVKVERGILVDRMIALKPLGFA